MSIKLSGRILITNDDGIDSPGIELLRSIASRFSDDVWVVAPSSNQGTDKLTFQLKKDPAISVILGHHGADKLTTV